MILAKPEIEATVTIQEKTELLALSANIQAGDRVLIGLSSQYVTAKHADDLYRLLHEWFPGVDFHVVAGVSCMAVQRGD